MFLDATAILDILKGRRELENKLKGVGELGVSMITVFEILGGFEFKRLERERRLFLSFLSAVEVFQLDRAGAEEAARIMGKLLRIGRAVNALDVLIAGTALANGHVEILTADEGFREIEKVSDLRVNLY